MPQKQYMSHYDNLKNRWTQKSKRLQKKLWLKHKDTLEWLSGHAVAGSMAGLVLLTNPINATALQPLPQPKIEFSTTIDTRTFLIQDLSHSLPETVQPLSIFQEEAVAQTLSRHFGIRVTPSLQGIKLNSSYGYIGQEQHLARYPGDSMVGHMDTEEDALLYSPYGMAPGLGAWGYFSPSRSQMSQKDVDREKYYVAVQTFLAPGYNDHIKEYNDFFRYRKLLVVNPENGKAVVADIADAGPSPWTGKQLGGSPEVMHYLQRVDGAQKGPVLYFFIDDPHDTIPLGPINPK